jgi:hypothetical protein
MYERIVSINQENAALKFRVEKLQVYADREAIPMQDRLPGFEMSVAEACKEQAENNFPILFRV